MPRITEERREQNRVRLIHAAWRCFARAGVGSTTMEQIAAEAGVATGAAYLYFAGKDELIRAAMSASLAAFEREVAALGAEADAATADGYLRRVLETVEGMAETEAGVDLLALSVQGWAHAQTDPATAEVLRTGYRRILDEWEAAAARWSVPDPAASARAIATVALGYVAQRALLGRLEPAALASALATLGPAGTDRL